MKSSLLILLSSLGYSALAQEPLFLSEKILLNYEIPNLQEVPSIPVEQTLLEANPVVTSDYDMKVS